MDELANPFSGLAGTKSFYETKYRTFDGIPGIGREKSSFLASWQQVIQNAGNNWRKNPSYLDLGCGFGHKTFWIASQSGVPAVGIDQDETVIRVASLLNPLTSLHFQTGNLEDSLPDAAGLVTAFGFSPFNTGDTDQFHSRISWVVDHLVLSPGLFVMSGLLSGPDNESWKSPTKNQLKELAGRLNKSGYRAGLLVPSNRFEWFLQLDPMVAVQETIRLFTNKPRPFFLWIAK